MAGEQLGHGGELVGDAHFVVPLFYPVVAQQVVGDDLFRRGSGEGEQHEASSPVRAVTFPEAVALTDPDWRRLVATATARRQASSTGASAPGSARGPTSNRAPTTRSSPGPRITQQLHQ